MSTEMKSLTTIFAVTNRLLELYVLVDLWVRPLSLRSVITIDIAKKVVTNRGFELVARLIFPKEKCAFILG
jgi:hypothetical protein